LQRISTALFPKKVFLYARTGKFMGFLFEKNEISY